MAKILIIASNIHKELSALQLKQCVELVKTLPHQFEVNMLHAGTYEIPFVINAYQKKNPFDAYIALGLLLDTNTYHFNYVASHIQFSFSHFALNHTIVGNGIIVGSSATELESKLKSSDPCMSGYASAVKAVDCLLRLEVG